jgi:hypothetical protein
MSKALTSVTMRWLVAPQVRAGILRGVLWPERLPSFASDLVLPRTNGCCALALCLLYTTMDGWWPVRLTTGWRDFCGST